MNARICLAGLASVLAALSLVGLAVPSHALEQGREMRFAQDDTREREAFEAAKELGTVEAWDAFLSNYPNGFRADLARAYVKKLGGTASAPVAAPAAAPVAAPAAAPPAAAPCYVTRVSYIGGDFSVEGAGRWVEMSGGSQFRFDETGRSPSAIELSDDSRGVKITLDFAARTVWYAEQGTSRRKLYDITGAGCGAAEPAPQQAYREPAYKTTKRTQEPQYFTTRPKKVVKNTSCGSGKTRVDGKCIRRADVASYCGPGYRMRKGKCVPGAYEAPKAKYGAPSGSGEAANHGCPEGQVWSAAELCHYDD